MPFHSSSSPSLRYDFPYAGQSPHKADFLFSEILSLQILFPTDQFPYRQPQMTALTLFRVRKGATANLQQTNVR